MHPDGERRQDNSRPTVETAENTAMQVFALQDHQTFGHDISRIAIARAASDPPIQRRAAPSATALSDGLNAGIEDLSGLNVSDVTVHPHSTKPAGADALGNQIHLGPDQEKHLTHVQPRQRRVPAIIRVGNLPINDDSGRKSEAGRMAATAECLSARGNPTGMEVKASVSPTGDSQDVVQMSVEDLGKWRDDIWNPVEAELSNAVYDVIASVEAEEIVDTGKEDPRKYYKREAKTLRGFDDGLGTDSMKTDERFANDERGGINTVGLRGQLDAVADGVRGRTLEVAFARDQAVQHRSWIQVGSIKGRGGDVSVRSGEGFNDKRTYQFKSTRSIDQGAVDRVIRDAAEQLRGKHGERPYTGDIRQVVVEIVSPENPFPGTPKGLARESPESILEQFRTRIGTVGGAGKLNGVDVLKIWYNPSIEMEDGTTVGELEQHLDGVGGVDGDGTVIWYNPSLEMDDGTSVGELEQTLD